MMDMMQGLLDSVWALSVGTVFGILIDRLGLIDWLLNKVMKK